MDAFSRADLVSIFRPISEIKWQEFLSLLPQNSERFAEKRKAEFIAGRVCAMEALKKLKGDSFDYSPGIGPNREPLWPANIVGSISHSKTQVGVVVSDSLSHLGLDIETPIEKNRYLKISSQFITETERAKFGDDPYGGTLIFSAKEALFKALYPSVKTFFGFMDAEVIEITEDSFKIQVLRADDLFQDYKSLISGSYIELNNEIITLVSLP